MTLFEWDPRKAASNRRKHGISFADSTGVFEDVAALTVADDTVEEERWVTIGLDLLGRILVVVYTWRGKSIRLISARRATKEEQNQYLENS